MNATRNCSADTCSAPHVARGLCSKHYQRAKRLGTTDLPTREQRFWAKVDKSGNCWLWTSPSVTEGYGMFGHERSGKRAMVGAHRYSWELANGPIPAGLEIDHTCHQTLCVNPAHLRLATPKQNNENLGVLKSNNKSGYRGVIWEKRRKTWRAQVGHRGKHIFIGYFDDLDAAAAAAAAKRNELHTHNDLDRAQIGSRD